MPPSEIGFDHDRVGHDTDRRAAADPRPSIEHDETVHQTGHGVDRVVDDADRDAGCRDFLQHAEQDIDLRAAEPGEGFVQQALSR